MAPRQFLSIHNDLPAWALYAAVALAAASAVVLGWELWRKGKVALPAALTGLLALVALLLAVLRPVHVTATESSVGPKVVVLVDRSRSMALKGDGDESRAEVQARIVTELSKSLRDARIELRSFGRGDATPWTVPERPADDSIEMGSDLSAAIRSLAKSAEEKASAIVVLSDGQWDSPSQEADDTELATLSKAVRAPIHTIAVSEKIRPDASVRRVSAAGAAVAHVPLALRIEVSCVGDLPCDELPVLARELRDGAPPALLASGTAKMKGGTGSVELTVTLERAGTRIVEVSIAPPEGDTIAANDRRLIPMQVVRERVRLLHVAGRTTYDVRALRQWIKGNASVDNVAFFILRTPTDNPRAAQNELALIPFPVDELFSEHLPSFDAVVLQDFDAQPYGLERHLPAIASYVRSGGGLIMVGGPNSFVAGGYADTALADVLPVELRNDPGSAAADLESFVPQWTEEGRRAPLLEGLRTLLGDDWPPMPGANVLGPLRASALSLLVHPTRKTKAGGAMPVLAIGEYGDGRSIALGVDGAWLLSFGSGGARTGGRGHTILWDGLLGWLMRDPKYEPAQIDVREGCVAGVSSVLWVRTPAAGTPVKLRVERLDRSGAVLEQEATSGAEDAIARLRLSPLAVGAYAARVDTGRGQATRKDFACEAGGDEWADPRPDAARMGRLAAAAGGKASRASATSWNIPLPPPTLVSSTRTTTPVAPAWVWTLVASMLLGAHWWIRRREGLA